MTLPVIDRDDVDSVLVARGDHPQLKSCPLPDGVLSVNCYRNATDCLFYVQLAAGASPFGDTPWTRYRLHRVVRGSGVPAPAPVPTCFPAAFFPVTGQDPEAWIDALLAAEESHAGTDRAYEGGIAANFHISLDDTTVMIFSEWVSEKDFTAHLDAVVDPIVRADTGHHYRHDWSRTP
ncbi:hypothetical protein ACWGE0_35220 [Lentzea sp. NPDC054927]